MIFFPIFRHVAAPWWPNTEINETEMLYPDRFYHLIEIHCACKLWTGMMTRSWGHRACAELVIWCVIHYDAIFLTVSELDGLLKIVTHKIIFSGNCLKRPKKIILSEIGKFSIFDPPHFGGQVTLGSKCLMPDSTHPKPGSSENTGHSAFHHIYRWKSPIRQLFH